MNTFSILALAGAMFLLAATPGPGVFATLARALASGFSQALAVIIGIVIGDLIFLMLAIFGMAMVAEMLGELFLFIKIAGGIYLLWLGYRIWTSEPVLSKIQETSSESSWFANLASGLVITLGNPKVILFYIGFLPTFLDLSSLTQVDIVIVAVVVSSVVTGGLTGYAYAAARARQLFRSRRAVQKLNRGAGGVMMATGVVLVSEG